MENQLKRESLDKKNDNPIEAAMGINVTTVIRMDEIDYCVICGKSVPLDKDPSVCCDHCKFLYEMEIEFNACIKKELALQNSVIREEIKR